jgi:small-conductance mechanosensitive channel
MAGYRNRTGWRETAKRLAVDPDAARARAHRLEMAIRPNFRRAIVTGAGALIALSIGEGRGGLNASSTRTALVAIGLAGLFVVLAVLAVRSAGTEVARVVESRAGGSAAGTVRLMILLSGYLVTLIAVLGLLQVPLGRLLVGGAVTGVVVGIAAQQSLGHVFAGLVILLSRPFVIGDDIIVRSGSLGGPFQGTVIGMGLLFTTLATEEGPVHLPNAGLLASAVGPRPSASADPAKTNPKHAVPSRPTASAPVDLTSWESWAGDDTQPFDTSGRPKARGIGR